MVSFLDIASNWQLHFPTMLTLFSRAPLHFIILEIRQKNDYSSCGRDLTGEGSEMLDS